MYWIHVAASFVMRFVPVRVAYDFVAFCTPLWMNVFGRGYLRRATENMRQVLGPQVPLREARRLTRLAFANYARYLVDTARMPHLKRRDLMANTRIEGWEHVEAAFAVGKGVVLVTGHIGNWDLAGAMFAARGHPVNAIVETLSPRRWNERVQRTRISAGVKAIPVESGVRDMLAALRKHETLAVVVDRPLAAKGVPVTFFGRATRVPAGAATLALRTGSPVVPAVLVRDPRGSGFVAHIGPPILGNGAGKSAEVEAVMQRIMSWLEGVIVQYPDQWFMFRQMWPGSETPRPALSARLSGLDY